MPTLKARKRRVRRRSAKKRVRRTKGKKNRRRRRTYKGGWGNNSALKQKWLKHINEATIKKNSVHPANNKCYNIPRNYYKGIRKKFNTDPENPQIEEKNVGVWGDKMRADAINECERNASATTGTANPVDDDTMENVAEGAPVFNNQGDLISGIAPTVIPDGGGRRKSRRRRRKKSKQSKKRRRRKR